MSRAILWAMLVLLPVRWVCGQSPEPPAPIFPSDGKPAAQANGAELLEAVCPGQVEAGKDLTCRDGCPYFTGFKELVPWALTTVTRGHLLSPTSDDAVLSMQGCEAHPENIGGTILLTRGIQGWAMKWYKAGVDTTQCHKVLLQSAREILVCIGETGTAGNVIAELYVEDLRSPGATLRAKEEAPFLRAFDGSFSCISHAEDETEPFMLTRAFIERVEFPAVPSDAGLAISVTASFGRRSVAPEMVKSCVISPSAFLPQVKSYHLDFVFDGHDYKPTESSAVTARMFSSK